MNSSSYATLARLSDDKKGVLVVFSPEDFCVALHSCAVHVQKHYSKMRRGNQKINETGFAFSEIAVPTPYWFYAVTGYIEAHGIQQGYIVLQQQLQSVFETLSEDELRQLLTIELRLRHAHETLPLLSGLLPALAESDMPQAKILLDLLTEAAGPLAFFALTTPLEQRLAKAAGNIWHCGDYAELYVDNKKKHVWWVMGDSDGGQETTNAEDIEQILSAVKGVHNVTISCEESPEGENWNRVEHDAPIVVPDGLL
jgi:hypothetical protein